MKEKAENAAFLIGNEINQAIIITESVDIKNGTTITKLMLDYPPLIGRDPYNISIEETVIPPKNPAWPSPKAIKVTIQCWNSNVKAEYTFPIGENVSLISTDNNMSSINKICIYCSRNTYANGYQISVTIKKQ